MEVAGSLRHVTSGVTSAARQKSNARHLPVGRRIKRIELDKEEKIIINLKKKSRALGEGSVDPGPLPLQDKARPHAERAAMNCLAACQILPWPARSPDLSLIEHVWDMMRRQPASTREC
ncbi:hypothetical protein TNCV_4293591 [Trichonephila clavipes]|uniref:Tc1-like transposase DDE domain-containing protein n=1 Tax=Trichonephila clavipes TaxID=2585209 RepID=A0A8X6RKZ8_TRICX|nr:hypothetical protein TNCV_4293591 [Trichonephila clavipes]